MSYYADTVIPMWVERNPQLSDFNLLSKEFGVHAAMRAMTERPDSPVSAAVRESVRNRQGSPVKIPVRSKPTIVAGSSRACSADNNDGVSALYQPTWQKISGSFTVLRHMFENNYITAMEDFDMKMDAIRDAFLTSITTKELTAIEAYKTAVMTDSLNYAVSGNTVHSTFKQREMLFGDLFTMMRANKYRGGRMFIIGNGGIDSTMQHLRQLGGNNAVDRMQEMNGFDFYFDTAITNAAAVATVSPAAYGTCYAIQSGAFAVLFRFSREANARERTPMEWWDIIDLPGFGPVEVHHKIGSSSDQHTRMSAGLDDMACSIADSFIFNAEIAIVPAYLANTSTMATPVIKADIWQGSFESMTSLISGATDAPPAS